MTDPTDTVAAAPPLRIAHTFELRPAERAGARALMDAAFDGDFSDEDWDHGLGGVHAFVRAADGTFLAHGSVIQRRVLHRGRSYRVGYVEAVAVRPGLRRQGLGGRVMAALERVIDGAYDLGALSASDDGAPLYRARGWRLWEGTIGTLGPGGVVRLPDEEDSTYLRPVAGRPLPGGGGPSGVLVFDWREGDVL
ncbi:GNAT family N-acetyltransferase [Streptomyces lushanensis]|uniref:GNAT family N-acetyltransferase n=1 Tax=Streptomyces lushanensis TaxID=1434255 RepID=UPI0008295978|nr:GNAT family N-acetyltransferase [Streptomyces lushanensis]